MWMIFHKPSPVGMLTLSSDGTALTGLWLDGQKYFGAGLPNAVKENDLPVFEQASAWLDAYFAKAPFTTELGKEGRMNIYYFIRIIMQKYHRVLLAGNLPRR